MKSNLDVLKHLVQTSTVDEIIDYFGGDNPNNALCALVDGEHIGCRLNVIEMSCKECIRCYLEAPASN